VAQYALRQPAVANCQQLGASEPDGRIDTDRHIPTLLSGETAAMFMPDGDPQRGRSLLAREHP
jgi:hypothetical protein